MRLLPHGDRRAGSGTGSARKDAARGAVCWYGGVQYKNRPQAEQQWRQINPTRGACALAHCHDLGRFARPG